MLPEKCWHCFMANFYGKFYGKWRSSNVGLVIDYACDFGGAGGVAGAVCVCVGGGRGLARRRYLESCFAHWVNEYSHADRNDAKSFPIAQNLSTGDRQWVGSPAIYLTSLWLTLSLWIVASPPPVSFYLTFVLAGKPKTFGPPINLLQLLFLSCSECVVCLLFPLSLCISRFLFLYILFSRSPSM